MIFFFSSRRRHTRLTCDWSSDVCSSDLLRSRQDTIVPSIQSRGGTVLGQFQHAINGIKVRGTPEQIRAFATLPGVVEVKPVRSEERRVGKECRSRESPYDEEKSTSKSIL